MPLETGDRLGPYEIKALLGIGGMGEVYRGRDTRLGRDVALKVIAPRLVGDPSFARRFEIEARAASVLNHPSIVTVYDIGETGGISWIAMEWVDGRTLRQALSEGPLPLRDALSITRQIVDGLAAAHAKGIVHRDLKPENVMLGADGRARILDFGLARQTLGEALEGPLSQANTLSTPPSDGTREGMILGTVGYMSPEQAAGRLVDFRSDQFALGLIAYEMLTGQKAFARPTAVETLSAVIREEPVPLSSLRSGIPGRLQDLIARCLAKRPDDRFASTRDLAQSLESLASSASVSIEPTLEMTTAGPPKVPRRAWARKTALGLGSALVLALATSIGTRLRAPAAIRSLAVLPFANASTDAEVEYLGDGLTESLINQMSRVPNLKVMARATVFRFKGTADPQEAGRKLGVGAVLTGTVSRRGNQLSISAELVEISTGARLWGEKYDRPFADLLQVQDALASDIAGGLRLRLSGQEQRTLGGQGTSSTEAYELSLKAHFFLVKDTEEGILEARRLFQEAARKDPRFVDAHLGVASTFAMTAVDGYERPAEAWSQMEDAALQARRLDPGNILVRCALTLRRFFLEWDWAGTEREFRELSLEPGLLRGEQFRPIGLYFWARGQPQEAVAIVERKLLVDPGDLSSRNMMANYLAEAGRLDRAMASYWAAREENPTDPRPLFGMAEVMRRRGDAQGAIDARRKGYELSGEEDGAQALAAAHTVVDYENAEAAVARSRLGEALALAKERYVSPLDLARLRARIGDREQAFASLEAAFAERSAGLVFLKVERAWDKVRDDARFANLVRRVGIP
jgi:serine/threonine-protein kinase